MSYICILLHFSVILASPLTLCTVFCILPQSNTWSWVMAAHMPLRPLLKLHITGTWFRWSNIISTALYRIITKKHILVFVFRYETFDIQFCICHGLHVNAPPPFQNKMVAMYLCRIFEVQWRHSGYIKKT